MDNPRKLRLVGYLRCSTEGQIDGFGLESQRQAITAWANANGHRIIEVVSDEAVSGTTEALERDGLSSAIDAIQRGRADGEFTFDRNFDGEKNTRPSGIIHVVAGGGGATLYGPGLEKTAPAWRRLP